MKKKKAAVIGIMMAAAFSLAACSQNTGQRETGETSAAQTSQETESPETERETESPSQETEVPETDSQVLVAYFSHTGNTREAAEIIADQTGGDLAEIQRAEEYGDLYEEAEAEILEGVRPEITVDIDSLESYDTVFVGYPIWWDEAPAMIATFLEENDFSGKRVIPFCTSSSDSIDNSLHIFHELCPDAVIEEGLTANDLDDIGPWLSGLGF